MKTTEMKIFQTIYNQYEKDYQQICSLAVNQMEGNNLTTDMKTPCCALVKNGKINPAVIKIDIRQIARELNVPYEIIFAYLYYVACPKYTYGEQQRFLFFDNKECYIRFPVMVAILSDIEDSYRQQCKIYCIALYTCYGTIGAVVLAFIPYIPNIIGFVKIILLDFFH